MLLDGGVAPLRLNRAQVRRLVQGRVRCRQLHFVREDKRTGAYGFFIGSRATTKKVAMGPRNSEISHQLSPLLPLACAKPALMSDRVIVIDQTRAIEVALPRVNMKFGVLRPAAGIAGGHRGEQGNLRAGNQIFV